MRTEPSSLFQRYVALGHSAGDDDRRRLTKASLTLVASLICLFSPVWVGIYLLLGRPLAAVIPAFYVGLSMIGLVRLFLTKRHGFFVGSQIVAMFVLPISLQWVLGGFVQGSAVALWSFAAVMAALVAWGIRPATYLFAGFAGGMLLSGAVEGALRSVVAPLPSTVQTGFFVLNVSAPLATAFALLVYFNRERDAAMAVSESLLGNILPAAVVRQLKLGRRQVAERHEEATVAFIDFVSFTPFAERTEPEQVVEVLDRAFSALDELATRFGVEKIKTLGDGYLAAAGVTEPRADHAAAVAELALATADELRRCVGDDWPDLLTRIGIATGPVIAGVIGGERRMGFDLWGDTVNTASRMASHAAPGTIQLTEVTARALRSSYLLERRRGVEVKGKGRMDTWLLLGRQPDREV